MTCGSTSRRIRTCWASDRARLCTPSWTGSWTITPEVIEGLALEIDAVEAEVFAGNGANPTERIYKLKREVLEFKRAVAPLVEPMQRWPAIRPGSHWTRGPPTTSATSTIT